MKRCLVLLHLIVAAGCMLAACGGAPASVQVVTLRAREFGYEPATLDVKAGTPVRLTVTNNGTLDHTFAIPGLVREIKMLPGQSATVEFVPSASGEYKFLCTVAGHEALGMAGTISAR